MHIICIDFKIYFDNEKLSGGGTPSAGNGSILPNTLSGYVRLKVINFRLSQPNSPYIPYHPPDFFRFVRLSRRESYSAPINSRGSGRKMKGNGNRPNTVTVSIPNAPITTAAPNVNMGMLVRVRPQRH